MRALLGCILLLALPALNADEPKAPPAQPPPPPQSPPAQPPPPAPANTMKPADRVRRWIVPAPILIFLYTLFAKRLFLDGWPGFFYVLQRTLAEVLLSLRLIEAKLTSDVAQR